MSKRYSRVVLATALFALFISQNAFGMHIAEGFLSIQWCLIWYAITLPVLAWGIYSIKKQTDNHKEIKLLIGVSGAFVFLLSALKIPSVTGSCSHMSGTGLGAILFGPSITSVLALIVLLFQTLLLAHGGLTTLGANTFSMGIAGPFVAWGIIIIMLRLKVKRSFAVFTATFASSLITYSVTAIQLALAYPAANGSFVESFIKFGTIFSITQVPLSVIEGIISVMLFNIIQSQSSEELVTIRLYGGTKL